MMTWTLSITGTPMKLPLDFRFVGWSFLNYQLRVSDEGTSVAQRP